MKQLKLIDRVVVEILDAKCDDCPNSYVAAKLREIADLIESGVKGGNVAKPEDKTLDVLWEHEMKRYGGFKMGTQSLIRDAYYGAKEFFEVCVVSKDDIEQEGFDASKLTQEDMERIASKQGNLINEECDYWTALRGACEYWEVPLKKEEPEIMVADLAGRMVGWDKWQQVYYLGAAYGHNDGVVYKNQQAFDEHNGICYVPEHGFFDADGLADNVSDEMKEWLEEDHCGYVTDGAGGYTRDDIYAAFADHINYDGWLDEKEKEYGKPFMEEFIDKEIAYIFQELDWQCPDTFIQEMEWEEDWEEFVKDRLDDPRLTERQKKELGYK